MRLIVLFVVALAAVVSCRSSTAQPTEAPARQPRWLPESVRLERDIPYAGTDNPRQRLDLLTPRQASAKPLPVVVFIHGGAWLAGDKRAGLRQAAWLVESGDYAVASVGYRLSNEATWPAQMHDCKAAIRWLRANAAEHNLDPGRIGVWGPSAGGHLVAVLGTSGGVVDMEGDLGPHTDVSSRVACVVDFFGPTDLLKMNSAAGQNSAIDHDSSRAPEARLIGGPIQQNLAKAATANPITYVTEDDPPFLIVHGTADRLVPFNQSELLHAALRSAGLESTLITVDRGGHGRGFPQEVNDTVRKFLDSKLRGVDVELEDATFAADGQ